MPNRPLERVYLSSRYILLYQRGPTIYSSPLSTTIVILNFFFFTRQITGDVVKRVLNPQKAEFFFVKSIEIKRFFLIHLNTYVMGLRPLEIFLLLQCGNRL